MNENSFEDLFYETYSVYVFDAVDETWDLVFQSPNLDEVWDFVEKEDLDRFEYRVIKEYV